MKSDITGVVLAGGLARRMGGVDKGLQLLQGRPMVQWVLAGLAPQVDRVLISANQNLERYAEFGCAVLPDRIAGFAGPLAGLHAALMQTTTPLLATAPCDSPFLPQDLVMRLHAAMSAAGAQLAVARSGGRVHRAFSLVRREVLPQLDAFLVAGGRKVGLWHAALKVVEADFDDEAAAFDNINTIAELQALQDKDRRH